MVLEYATDRSLVFSVRVNLIALLLFGAPVQAQQIMSFEEYRSLNHAEPFTYRLETDSGALLYFGSRHSFDPTDPQVDQIEEAWNAFQPDVAYAEGGELSIESLSRKQAVERYGEFGVTWLLARRDGVPARSLDPSRAAEIAYLKKHGWSDEQLMLFFALRQVAQSQNQRVSIDLTEALPQYLNSLVQRFDLQGPTTLVQFEDTVGRLLPDVQTWKAIPTSYFYPGPQDPNYFTNEIATESSRFRDQYHVDLLVEAVRSGKRVFAISGSAHAVMQEPALRSRLQSR